MKYLIYCGTLLLFISFHFCRQEAGGDIGQLTRTIKSFNLEIEQLQNLSKSIGSRSKQRLQSDTKNYQPHFKDRKYLTYDNTVLYNPKKDGLCAVYAFGTPDLTMAKLSTIWALEPLEQRLKETVELSPIADRAYVLSRDSLGFIYPYLDIISYLLPFPGLHNGQINLFKQSYLHPDDSTAWTAPYMDSAGLGYIISLISLQQVNGSFSNVEKSDLSVSIDLSIRNIQKYLLKNTSQPVLILTADTILVATNEQALSVFPFVSLEEPYYINRGEKIIYSPDKYNFRKHPSIEIREFAEMIYRSSQFRISFEDRSYSAVSVPIKSLNWRLVHLTKN